MIVVIFIVFCIFYLENMHVCKQNEGMQYNRNFISFLPESTSNLSRRIRIMQWNIFAQGNKTVINEFILSN